MASDKKKQQKTAKTEEYQPKAAARHAKITKTKQDEIETFKRKIDNDKHLAKKYEGNRKTEIRALPKEDRAAAKAELKESVAKRKEAERRDREKLREMISTEKYETKNVGKEPFDEDTWIEGGRKKKNKKGKIVAAVPDSAEDDIDDIFEEEEEEEEIVPSEEDRN